MTGEVVGASASLLGLLSAMEALRKVGVLICVVLVDGHEEKYAHNFGPDFGNYLYWYDQEHTGWLLQ